MTTITKTIAIASDHAGCELKDAVKAELEAMGISVIDLGTNGNESVDYPDYGEKLAQSIINNQAEMGVAICGSGIGISIAANRHRQIRAALCHDEQTAALARQHNDANILALGARILDEQTALSCIRQFFTTEFEGGRHQRRVDKLSDS